MTDDVGSLLVRAGLLSAVDLKAAYEAAADAGSTLVEQLVDSGTLKEDRLCDFFRERLLVPRVSINDLERVQRRVLQLVPRDMAIAFRCLPLAADNGRNLALAMMDPSITHAVDEVRFFTGMTIYRVVAPASALAWALREFYGAATRLARATEIVTESVSEDGGGSEADAADADADADANANADDHGERAARPAPEVVDDVYGEDTPIPSPVPFDETTGRVVLIDPRSLSDALAAPRQPSTQSENALRESLKLLASAADRDAVAQAALGFLVKICRRAAFFTVRRGQVGELAGFSGVGVGIRLASLREAVLSLEVASTFRDIIRTRLPYRGPVIDVASRDFLIDALGWAPTDMLAVPLSVRERVVGILYGDEATHALPDDHLSALARAAELALERAILATKRPETDRS